MLIAPERLSQEERALPESARREAAASARRARSDRADGQPSDAAAPAPTRDIAARPATARKLRVVGEPVDQATVGGGHHHKVPAKADEVTWERIAHMLALEREVQVAKRDRVRDLGLALGSASFALAVILTLFSMSPWSR